MMKMKTRKTLALGALTAAMSAPLFSHAEGSSVGVVNTPQHRIIGGAVAAKTAFPWMVSVKSKQSGGHFCGASLIDKQWVLTAAHCVEKESGAGIQVTVSEYDQQKNDSSEQTFMVTDVYIHQKFDENTDNDNDIALLKLAGESTVTPIALADANVMANLNVGAELTTIGWGHTRDGDAYSLANVLRQVKVPLYDHAKCKKNYATVAAGITANMVCAGLETGGKDSCQGDSGGPLFVVRGGSAVQLGITSFGEACSRPSFPGVYARVASYRDWIAKVKKGEIAAHKPKPGIDLAQPKEVLGLPAELDLFVVQGLKSATEQLTLNNPKDAKTHLMIHGMNIRGDGFALKGNACVNQAIEPGKSCRFSVNYQAQTNKPFGKGQLQLKTNHPTHKTVNIELFALNGNAFNEADNVTCSILSDLHLNDDRKAFANTKGRLACSSHSTGSNNTSNINNSNATNNNSGNSNNSESANTNGNGDNSSSDKEQQNQALEALAGALHPFMLLGLLVLPLTRRRQ